MTIEDVIAWFGTLSEACVAIGIARQNTTKWKRKLYIPWKQQYRISAVTNGALVPDEKDPCPRRDYYYKPKPRKKV